MIALAVALLAGLPAALLADREAPLLRLIGEAMLLGVALCSGALFLLSAFGIRWTLARAMVVVIVVVAGLCVFIKRRPSIAANRLHVIDLLTLATIAGYALLATAGPPSDNDFTAIWGLKAVTFSAHGGIDWSFLRTVWYRWDHPDYPLLLPLTFDFMTLWTGTWAPETLGWLNVFFAVALIAILRSFFEEELRSPLYASLATLAVAPLAMSAWLGLAEGPLIAFGTAGILLTRRRNMTAAALLLGCAAMTKNEGLALVIAVAIALALTKRFRDIPRLWPAIAIALPWIVARTLFSLSTDITAGPMLSRALARLQAPGEIFSALATYRTGEPLLWIGIAAALLMAFRFLGEEVFALATIAIQMGFYFGAYFVTERNVEWHVRWSWERLVTHVTPTLAFVAIVLLYRFVRAPRPAES
jgi:hypothetical protein